MKIQIETNLKTITIEEPVNLAEFMELMGKLFPNNEWKEYKLEVKTIINWSNPIVIDRWQYPSNPWGYPWITYGASTGGDEIINTLTSNNGVYNVALN